MSIRELEDVGEAEILDKDLQIVDRTLKLQEWQWKIKQQRFK